jgi:mono/diheme cytochrome c family protein
MRVHYKISLFAGAIVSILIFDACQTHKYPLQVKKPETETLMAGEKYFYQYCQKCHPDAESGLGPSIYSRPSFAKHFQARHGWGAMPKFSEEVLSEKKLEDIVAYLHYVKKSD